MTAILLSFSQRLQPKFLTLDSNWFPSFKFIVALQRDIKGPVINHHSGGWTEGICNQIESWQKHFNQCLLCVTYLSIFSIQDCHFSRNNQYLQTASKFTFKIQNLLLVCWHLANSHFVAFHQRCTQKKNVASQTEINQWLSGACPINAALEDDLQISPNPGPEGCCPTGLPDLPGPWKPSSCLKDLKMGSDCSLRVLGLKLRSFQGS